MDMSKTVEITVICKRPQPTVQIAFAKNGRASVRLQPCPSGAHPAETRRRILRHHATPDQRTAAAETRRKRKSDAVIANRHAAATDCDCVAER